MSGCVLNSSRAVRANGAWDMRHIWSGGASAHVEEGRMMDMEFTVKVEGACPACSQSCKNFIVEMGGMYERGVGYTVTCRYRNVCRYAWEKSQMIERDKAQSTERDKP